MKKFVVGVLFTTGAALVIAALFFLYFDINSIPVLVVFQIFGANIVISLGITLLSKIEIRNVILEYLFDVSYIIVVLVIFGKIFNWYSIVPYWVLIIMAIVVYLFVGITSLVKIRKDTQVINKLLKDKKKNTAS